MWKASQTFWHWSQASTLRWLWDNNILETRDIRKFRVSELSLLTHKFHTGELPVAWLGDVDGAGGDVSVDVAARVVQKAKRLGELKCMDHDVEYHHYVVVQDIWSAEYFNYFVCRRSTVSLPFRSDDLRTKENGKFGGICFTNSLEWEVFASILLHASNRRHRAPSK